MKEPWPVSQNLYSILPYFTFLSNFVLSIIMKRPFHTLLMFILLSVMVMGTVACRSSKKSVSGSGSVPVRPVDYGEMRDDVKSRHYNIPQIGALIEEASRWLGVPYRYAGNDKKGVDCSGLTSQVYLRTLNVKMPRSSREQQQWCINIKKENLQPGDLVFFATGSNRNRVSHVGIYIGNGDIIHASSSRGVIVSNLGEKYYHNRYHSSGRPTVIHRLYAAEESKSKKQKVKSRDAKSKSRDVITPQPDTVAGLKPNPAITISVDDLIEMQIDSIAASINTTPALVPQSTVAPTSPQSPVIVTDEPSDTVFNQFFD